ncbi:MAG: 50S ribosomal protein L11 methyltransferase [Candidatus Latescibacterota bacterium]
MWKTVSLSCEPECGDLLSTLIFESGFTGLEEQEDSGLLRLKAYCPQSLSPDPVDVLKQLMAATFGDDASDKIRITEIETIPDEDWEIRWREGLGAVEAGKSLVIRPSWVNYSNVHNRIEIIIDPKMAFGSGSHGSTYLCLEAMEKMTLHGKTVIDAGCGSGVLSIAAARLGALRVFGFDNDPFSVDNAKENVLINGVQEKVTIELFDLEQAKPEPVDMVFGNLIYNVLVDNLHHLRSFLKPGGKIIFSGLLSEQEIPFLENLHKECFRVISLSYREEWMAVTADLRS